MKTPKHRFTVMPFLTAFFAALALLPSTAVVQVNALGMGLEHEQGWRRPASAFVRIGASARGLLSRLTSALVGVQRHALFRPGLATAGLMVAYLYPEVLLGAPLLMGTTLTEGYHTGEAVLGTRPDGGSRESITVLSGQNLSANEVIGRVSRGIGRVSIPTVVATASANGTVSNVFGGPDVEVGTYTLTCTSAVTHGGVWSLTTPGGKALPSLTMTPGSGGSTNYRSRHINFTITDGSTDFAAGDVFSFVVSTTAPTVIGGTGTGTLSGLALGPAAKPGNYRVIFTEAITNGGRFQVYRIGPNGGESLGEYLLNAGSTNATTFETPYFSFTITDAADFIVGNYFDVCVFNQLNGGKVVEWDPTTYDGRHEVAGVLLSAVDASSADTAGVIIARDAVVMKDALQWATAITSSQKESAYKDFLALGIVAR